MIKLSKCHNYFNYSNCLRIYQGINPKKWPSDERFESVKFVLYAKQCRNVKTIWYQYYNQPKIEFYAMYEPKTKAKPKTW